MTFPSIRIEGAILSPDILDRIEDAPGQKPADFGLDPSAKVKDEIARAWADAQDYWRIFQRKVESRQVGNRQVGNRETGNRDSGYLPIAHVPALTTETRQQWIVPLLGLLGYQLEYQPKGAELNGKTYAISHRAINRARTPVHIVGYRDPAGLDRKPEVRATGGSPSLRMSPHAMVQEYINLHDQLYGIVTNGRLLRLLRDSSRLVKLSYLEFDLDRIFSDGLFADFALLYRLLHATRLPVTSDTAAESLIERYHQDSIEQGTRIRDGLRAAVTQALEIFGTGFIATPENRDLREQIDSGALEHTVFFSHLMRLIYRLLFLNVVEERGLIFPKGTPAKTLGTYYDYYSVQRLRRLARTRGLRSERHCDAWASLLSTFQIFERPDLAAKLGTTAFGGKLFNAQSLGPLVSCRLSNAAFFNALDRLCSFDDPKTNQRLPVNFGALATEEFGSVYESLLELHPVIETAPSPGFSFKQTAGNDRKTSGSYYTPSCLVDCLLDSALDPVLETRIRDHKTLGFPNAEAAILALKICDPACGSGHFLIAAAQRVARRLALIRAGDEEPAPDQMRRALREVISHCIYAVDINPMAVELCRVALWLEAVEPGKPLSFLNNHIQCGNSLLGTTPALLKRGIPDAAYEPIEGDDKKFAAAWKKRNREAKLGQHDLFADSEETWHYQNALLAATKDIEAISDESFTDVERKEAAYSDYLASSSYRFGKRLHDAWCAAFVWRKTPDPAIPEPITQQVIDQMKRDPNLCPERVAEEIDRLASQYNFFHWHLAFPDVFQPVPDAAIKKTDITGWSGGFDCILGNPPWEHTELKEKEFFAERCPEISNAATSASRKVKIHELQATKPTLWEEFIESSRHHKGQSHFLGNSGLYPLCGRGRINLYAVFAELSRQRIAPLGCMGLVLPSGIATDDTTKFFFQDLVEKRSLVSVYDFENRLGLFPAVDSRMKFCLFTSGSAHRMSTPSVSPSAESLAAEFVFYAHRIEDLRDSNRRFTLTADDIFRLSPNTKTSPIFRSRQDATLTKAIYARIPPLLREGPPTENPWNLRIRRIFNMGLTEISSLAKTIPQLEAMGIAESRTARIRLNDNSSFVPMLEGKMFEAFNHRSGGVVFNPANIQRGAQSVESTKSDIANPYFSPSPLYWFPEDKIACVDPSQFAGRWIFGFKDVASATNERSMIATILPWAASNFSIRVIQFLDTPHRVVGTQLLACFNSYVFDYLLRQSLGGLHVSDFITYQLPVLLPDEFNKPCKWIINSPSLKDWLLPRVLELTYSSWDLEQFAQDCGYDGPPFKWDDERRFLLRCELDAAFFHLYLGNDNDWQKTGAKELLAAFPTPRDAVPYIMDTFPIVKRKDEAAHGTYRTKDTILAIYDAMQTAIRTGTPYQTLLDPPPGPPVAANGSFVPVAKWDSHNWPKHIHSARNGGAHEV